MNWFLLALVYCTVQILDSYPVSSSDSITFTTEESFIRLVGYEGSIRLNFSLEFRTFQNTGLILYHKLSSDGYVKVALEGGQVATRIQYLDTQPLQLIFNQNMSDGEWHALGFYLDGEEGTLTLDKESLMSTLVRDVRTGGIYDIGGGIHGESGFRGCIRNLTIDGKLRLLEAGDGIIRGCSLEDTCGCQNNGRCLKDKCDCTGTGFTGTVCTLSIHPTSCKQALYSGMRKLTYTAENSQPSDLYTVDIDGPGPIEPQLIPCSYEEGKYVTRISHDNQEPTKVDGFQDPGSFRQTIHYQVPWEFIHILTKTSQHCTQYLRYDCLGSKLLEGGNAWWVNSAGNRMKNWAGIHPNQTLPGKNPEIQEPVSGYCSCGLQRSCQNPAKHCNCDSPVNYWLFDEGVISDKAALPVSALFFGDTGTPFDNKEGRFTLGPLVCRQDLQLDIRNIKEMKEGVFFAPFDQHFNLLSLYFKVSGLRREKMEILEIRQSKEKSHGFKHKEDRQFSMGGVEYLDDHRLTISIGCNSMVMLNEIETQTNIRFCDETWHHLVLDRSHLGFYLAIDNTEVAINSQPIPDPVLWVGGRKDESRFHGWLGSVHLDDHMINLDPIKIAKPRIEICQPDYCKNGGKRVERNSKPVCDCSKTSKRGEFCEESIGLSFTAKDTVTIDLRNQSIHLRNIEVSVTTKSRDVPILEAVARDSTVLSMYLTMTGQISLTLYLGRQITVLVLQSRSREPRSLHHISMAINQDSNTIQVSDGINTKMQVLKPATLQYLDSIQYIRLGGGMEGCLENLMVNNKAVLKLLNLPNQSLPGTCDSPSKLRQETEYYTGDYNIQIVTNSLVLGLGVSLIVVLISLAVLTVLRYLGRQKGGYYTREDIGTVGARDPDTAVLNGVTGHKVERRREWIL